MKSLSFKTKKIGSTEHGHNLTSLVDCFAIILVYLLMATSFGQIELDIPRDMTLPRASEGTPLTNPLVIQVHQGHYLLNKQVFELSQLAEELKRLADESKESSDSTPKGLVIQADRQLQYGELNPVIVAGLQAGFDEVQFAVQEEETR